MQIAHFPALSDKSRRCFLHAV